MAQFNANITLVAPNPLDDRYLSQRIVAGAQQPYSATTEVNATIDAGYRYTGLTVNINGTEYWYAEGIGDGDLVVKTMGGAGTLTGATNGIVLVNSGTTVALGGSLTGDTTINASGSSFTISNTTDFQVKTSGDSTIFGVDDEGFLLQTTGGTVTFDDGGGLKYGSTGYSSGFTSTSIPDVNYVTGFTSGNFLKLDQSTAQTISGGTPIFCEGVILCTGDTSPLITGHTRGFVFYDTSYQTLAVQIGSESTLQIGQENVRWVYNNTGTQINDGSLVYVTGVHSNGGSGTDTVTVALAIATGATQADVIGMATQDIPNGEFGFITTNGNVNGLNTSGSSSQYSGMTIGDRLYLSDTVAGGVTNVAPSSPSINIDIGRLVTKDPVNGKVFIDVNASLALNDLIDVSTPSPATDNVLQWNGMEWVPGVVGSTSAGSGVAFYYATPIINSVTSPAGISSDGTSGNGIQVATLSKTPVTSGGTVVVVGATATETRAFAAWQRSDAINRTSIDAGTWKFYDYAGVDNSSNVTTLTNQIYQIVSISGATVTTTGSGNAYTATTTGNQFTGTYFSASTTNTNASYLQTPSGVYQISSFIDANNVGITVPSSYSAETSVVGSVWNKLFDVTTDEIDSVLTGDSAILYETSVTAPAFTVAETDKLGQISFVTSNATHSVILSYNGTTAASYISTPLITLHNDLAGLQGGSAGERYHLSEADATLVGGITADASEINILDGATINTNELNILGGALITTTELNYLSGATSNIQNQLDNKLTESSFTGYTATTQPVIDDAITGATNVGSGTTVYSGSTDRQLYFNTLKGSGGTDIQKIGNEIIISSVGASGGTYNLASPSVCEVGGMEVGTVLTGKTAFQILQEILVPELCGTLTAPSFSTTLNPSATYYEIGCTISSLDVCGTFNRGCINPQYCSASDKRVGDASCYIYTGVQIDGTYPSTACTISQNVSSYTVSAGTETWGITVCYDAGVTPLGNNGTAFATACPAGTLNNSKTICGVFPIFATTASVGTLTKQTPYVSMETSPVQLVLAAEDGVNKQQFEIPDLWYSANSLKCICTYNTFSSAWEFEGGSGAASLTTWTPSSSSETTCCGSTPYCLFTYNGANRFTTTCIRLVF